MAGVLEAAKAALGCLTFLSAAATTASREALVRGLVFYPAVGLALGTIAALATVWLGTPGGPVAVILVLVLEGGRGPVALARPGNAARPTPVGVVTAALAFGGKLWAAAVLPPALRPAALLVAPMLGAWAVVVQCYGGSPGRARGVAAALIARARFQEFGWASTLAFAVTLALADALGLVMLVAAAVVTVAVRAVAYRRLGGLTGRLLMATRELVETVVLVVLALLTGRGT